MFFSIHVEAEPHSTIVNLSLFLKSVSQAVFRFPRNMGSFDPIHDISSSRTITRPRAVALAR